MEGVSSAAKLVPSLRNIASDGEGPEGLPVLLGGKKSIPRYTFSKASLGEWHHLMSHV